MDESWWNRLWIAAAALCPLPFIITVTHTGWPGDVGWAERVFLALFPGALLAMPQLIMWAFLEASGSKGLRLLALIASVGMLIAYTAFVPTVDLASDALAGLGFFFFQFYLAVGALVAGGVVASAHRLLCAHHAGPPSTPEEPEKR